MGIYSGHPCDEDCHKFRMEAAERWIEVAEYLHRAFVSKEAPSNLPSFRTFQMGEGKEDATFSPFDWMFLVEKGLTEKTRMCGVGCSVETIQVFASMMNAWRLGLSLDSTDEMIAFDLAMKEAQTIHTDAIMRLFYAARNSGGKTDADLAPGAVATQGTQAVELGPLPAPEPNRGSPGSALRDKSVTGTPTTPKRTKKRGRKPQPLTADEGRFLNAWSSQQYRTISACLEAIGLDGVIRTKRASRIAEAAATRKRRGLSRSTDKKT